MIRRSPRPDTGFTIIRNDVLRDERLSYRARGLLTAILSRPDNWTVSRDRLAADGQEGRDAVGTALQELETCGYIVRHRFQAEDGCWRTETVVYDTPHNADSSVNADFQSPETENQSSVFQSSVFQSLIEETTRRNDKKTCSSPAGDGDFDRFWRLYPRKVGREAARKAYTKALKAGISPDTILAGLEAHLPDLVSRETRYRPHPATWLNQHRWADELETTVRSAVELLRDELERGEPR